MAPSHTLYIRSADGQQEEWLTSANLDTFSWTHSLEEQSVTFTAYRIPGVEVSFNLLQNEAVVVFDGQDYIIKQSSPKFESGILTKSVTATHVHFECQYFRVYTKNTGAKNYTIDQMMDYVWANNPGGFDYEVSGDFPTVSITDWGNCSGLDALQKAQESYGAIVLADNKHVTLYDQNSYKRQTNNRFTYTNNTSQIDLSVDTTALQNEAMCYGATIDDSHMKPSVSGASGDSGQITDYLDGLGAVGTIQFAEPGAGVPVMTSPDGKSTGQVLKNGTQWKAFAQESYNGTTWYNLGGSQWVSGDYMTFEKDGDVAPSDPTVKVVYGIGTIKLTDDDLSKQDYSGNLSDAKAAWKKANDALWDWNHNHANYYSDQLAAKQKAVATAQKSLKAANDAVWKYEHDPEAHKNKNYAQNLADKKTRLANAQTTLAQRKQAVTEWTSGDHQGDFAKTQAARTKTLQNAAAALAKVQKQFSDNVNMPADVLKDGAGNLSVYMYKGSTDTHKQATTVINGSQWKINGEVNIHGETWYRIGNDLWVDSKWFDFSGSTDVEPQEPKDTKSSGKKGDTNVKYYFQPFLYQDTQSIAEWGERPGPDLSNDQIKTQDAMEQYAANTLQAEPVMTLSVQYDDWTVQADVGDVWWLDAKPLNMQTMITVNGVTRNPFRHTAPTFVLDNAKQTMKDINAAFLADIRHGRRYSDLLNYTIKQKLMTGSDSSGS